jgi:selenocysteine lyase/cysteine desulfurase
VSYSDRRKFLGQLGIAFAGVSLPWANIVFSKETENSLIQIANMQSEAELNNEDFWGQVKLAYSSSSSLLNFNNGGVSPQPKAVQEAFIHYYKSFNQAPSYYMWRIYQQEIESVRKKLARLSGADVDEIALNRNSTEALDTIIFGIELKKDDEVVISNFDYPNMVQAWRQREKREGIVLKTAQLEMPMENDDEIVSRYVEQFTKKTKVVLVTHLINWSGQIMPVAKIAKEARKRGIKVISDSAHSFAHLSFKIPDLKVDYFGTSLHKWLCAPLGSGLLWVRKELISDLWPGLSPVDPKSDDIRKFENLGTRNMAAELATGKAVDFHNMIGDERKEARLRYLKNYWLSKAKNINGFRSFTSEMDNYSCAIATVNIDGIKNLGSKLQRGFQIHTTNIKHEGVDGVRITPNVYTSIKELDRLVEALNTIAKNG